MFAQMRLLFYVRSKNQCIARMNAFLSYRVSTLLIAISIFVAILSSGIFETHALLIPAIPLIFRFLSSGSKWHAALGVTFVVAFLAIILGEFVDRRDERLDAFHSIAYVAPLLMILGILYPLCLSRWWPESIDPPISEQDGESDR